MMRTLQFILPIAASIFAGISSYAQEKDDVYSLVMSLDSSTVRADGFNAKDIAAGNTLLVNLGSRRISPDVTMEKVLRLTPQIDIRERGGRSVQTDIGIRGGSPDQSGILLNGVEFTDIRTGHQTHSLPIDADAISDVSLLEGGSLGLTGALNVIAAPLYDNYLRFALSSGAYGYRYANISGATTVRRKGELEIFEAVSSKKSDGYRPGTDFRNTNLYSRIRYSRDRVGTVDFQVGCQDRSFGANGFYSLRYPDQYEQTTTSLASLRWRKGMGGWLIDSYVSYRGNTDRFELIRGSESTVPFNYHITGNYGANASVSYNWVAGRTGLNARVLRSDILSTVLGEPLDKPVRVEGGSGRFYTRGGSRTTGSVILSHRKIWDALSAKAAVECNFSPYALVPLWNVGIFWNPSDKWSFDIIGARSMRLPTFNDLYYSATGYIGNPDIGPENATMVISEIGYACGNWKSGIDIFYRHGENIIDWVKKSAGSDWESCQLTYMNTVGADLSLIYSADAPILRYLTFRSGWIHSDKSAGSLISKYAMDYMRFKSSLSAELQLLRNLTLSADLSYYDRAGNYVDAEGSTVAYSPYALLNAGVSYAIGPFRFYVDADNVTSTKYFDFGGLEMPGIWVTGGIVVTLL